jgi:hypothetical protein
LPANSILSVEAPAVVTSNILTSDDEENLIRRGFPAAMKYVVELWPAAGFTNRAVSSAAWSVVVAYDPLEKKFKVARFTTPDGVQSLGTFAEFGEVRALLQRPYQPRIRTTSVAGRYYYAASLDVERITDNDFAEMRSWLGTALAPERSPSGAFLSFLGSFVRRLIGAEKRRYTVQSSVFVIDPPEDGFFSDPQR